MEWKFLCIELWMIFIEFGCLVVLFFNIIFFI